MSTVIKCELSAKSIEQARQELKDYQKSLNNKLRDFFSALLETGQTEAQNRLQSTIGDSVEGVIVTEPIVDNGDSITAIITLMGKDALFIEFGSGIAYNTGMTHPKADEFGYGVGTYPSKHPPNKAINPGYWYYREEGNDKVVRSIGTQASMPIYYASEVMRNNAVQKAVEIFRS